MEITFPTLSHELDQSAINICGLPCLGDCHTCVQSNADLSAFYGLPQEATTEGDEDSENRVLEEARAMDQIEEAQRSGEAYDYEEEEYHGFHCHCETCLTYEDDRYDDGYGLDWNESGYFD